MGTVAERRNPFCSLPVSEDEMDSCFSHSDKNLLQAY